MTLLSRYEAGDFEAVWQEIRSHSRLEEEFRAEVLEVAEAATKRVARNADMLAERLSGYGWKPLSPEITPLRTRPTEDDEDVFSRIEELTGAPLQPTLLALWNVVGGINLVWDYDSDEPVPDLGIVLTMDEMDPLCVDAPSAVTYQFKEWELHEINGEFVVDLAPDYFFKAGVSGGNPYRIFVSFPGADPVFDCERHELPFLDYLRLAFRWAGFPGLEDYAERPDVQRFVERFGQGLEPF
jgi:hypothetical protein